MKRSKNLRLAFHKLALMEELKHSSKYSALRRERPDLYHWLFNSYRSDLIEIAKKMNTSDHKKLQAVLGNTKL
jgi:hypothetical protein